MTFKKIFSILFVTLILSGPAAYSHEENLEKEVPQEVSSSPFTKRRATIRADLGTTTLALAIGSFGTTLGFDYAVSNNWTLGLTTTLGVAPNWDEEIVAGFLTYGLRGQYFFEDAFSDSWYLAPIFFLVNYVEYQLPVAGLLTGYKFIWESGLNFQLGAGLIFVGEVYGSVDLSLGFSF